MKRKLYIIREAPFDKIQHGTGKRALKFCVRIKICYIFSEILRKFAAEKTVRKLYVGQNVYARTSSKTFLTIFLD